MVTKLHRVLRITRPHLSRLYLTIAVSLLLTLLMIFPPYMTKLLFDQVYPNQDKTLLYIIVLATALFSTLSNLIGQAKDYFVSYLNMRIALGTNFEFYRHLSKLDVAFFTGRRVGEISSRARDALDSVGGIMQVISTFITNSITVLIFPPILLLIDWKLALLALAIVPIDFGISLATSKYTASKTRQVAKINAQVNAQKIEFLAGMSTIQALSIEDEMFAKIRRAMMNSAHIRMGVVFWQGVGAFSAHVVGALSVLFYTWYGWTRILGGEMTLGTYMAFTMYSGYLTGPIRGLLGLVPQLQVLVVHIDRFLEIYDLQPKVSSSPQALVHVRDSDVVYDSVSFSYEAGSSVLENINLTIPSGSTVAILGASGAGKTSLVQLLPRFYDPVVGVIRIGGTDVRRLQLDWLRGRVSYMQQRPFIFNGSIYDNIRIGHQDPDREAIEEAARKACLFDSVLDDGLETQAGEGGARLSEGQKQRIGLARVLLRKSPIVILDEATSGLDLETESRLIKTLHQDLSHSTLIIVTHRLTASRDADQVVVLKDGGISEQGDFRSLASGAGLLAQMHAKATDPLR